MCLHVDPNNPGRKKVVSAAGGLMKWAETDDEWRIKLHKTDSVDFPDEVVHYPQLAFGSNQW